MKLNSAPRRDKEHKLIKDTADIYALLWHSNIALPELKSQLFSIYPKQKATKTIQNFTKQDLTNVSAYLNITPQELSRVLNELL